MSSQRRLIEIREIFKAEPCTISNFLNVPGRCFMIPSYQRDFDWSTSNVTRLLQDVCHGWLQTVDQELAATFLGSIIVVLPTSRDEFAESVQHYLPEGIATVVDGQQRITTLLMTVLALHNALSRMQESFQKKTGDAEVWMRDQASLILGVLKPMMELEMPEGDLPYKCYPRLIRRPDDVWARKGASAVYKSPIARILNSYSGHMRSAGGKKFAPSLPPDSADDYDVHRQLVDTFRYIERAVTRIAQGDSKSFDVPSLEALGDSQIMQYSLLDVKLPATVKERLDQAAKKEAQGKRDAFATMTRLVMFSRYLGKRVAVTLINAMNEEYAFDIFESLNTAGEPLTAYQTFKPRVVAAVGTRNWKASTERGLLDIVEAYLRGFGTTASRQRKTAELLTTFALAEAGQKLSLRLSEQRRWLHRGFDALQGEAEKQREFVRSISNTAAFMANVWPEDTTVASNIPIGEPHNDLARLCLGVLRQANHTIAIPLISRFYGAWHRADAAKQEDPLEELLGTLKAVTAFWVLWRLSRRDTGGIDDIHRGLMANGFARVMPGGKTAKLLEASAVRAELRQHLVREGVGTKDKWVSAVSRVPAYGNDQASSRFALLAAMHDTVRDEANPGMWKTGRASTYSAMNFGSWADEVNLTIEHVAPKTKGGGSQWDWAGDLYEDSDTINLLGNLVLCPHNTNASLGNESWLYKSAVYRVLAAVSLEEFDAAMAAAAANGIAFGDSTKQLLDGHRHLRQMQAFHGLTSPWDRAFVLKRTENLAGLAWDRLSPWLGLSAQETENGSDAAGLSARAMDATQARSDSDDDLLSDDE